MAIMIALAAMDGKHFLMTSNAEEKRAKSPAERSRSR
jgi:hypothetical protein